MTHNNPKTYPRLATPVAFIEPEDLLEAAAAVVRLHRDHGDRGNRRHARLKYVIAEHGEDWARARLCEYLGKELESCRPLPPLSVPDHLGWHEQGDGKLYVGIPVASGRIVDGAGWQIRTALREIVARFRCDPILMPSQDIILSEIRAEDRDAITAILRGHGVRLAEDMLPAERWALACPALPTCGLALTEAERVRDDIVAAIEASARPLWAGARAAQHPHHRLPQWLRPALYRRYRHRRPHARLLRAVCRRRFRRHPAQHADRRQGRARRYRRDARPAFCALCRDRIAGEGFGDFCHRVGMPALAAGARAVQRGAASCCRLASIWRSSG